MMMERECHESCKNYVIPPSCAITAVLSSSSQKTSQRATVTLLLQLVPETHCSPTDQADDT